jgi:glycerophosphoryl diester phosphodiesterase
MRWLFITTSIWAIQIGNNEQIPTLEEVFRQIGNKLHYELELKGFTEEFVVRVVELVKKYRLTNMVEFTSPHAYVLMRVKELESAIRAGRFVASLPDWMDKSLGQTLAIHEALLGRLDVLHCPLELIDEEFITSAHENRLSVHAADCDTEQQLKKAFALHVDQLSTNKLERAVSMKKAI